LAETAAGEPAVYEIRLGGGKIFHTNSLARALGGLTIAKAPHFAQAPDFPAVAREGGGGRGVWQVIMLGPGAMENNFPSSGGPSQPAVIDDRTPGVGFIYLSDLGGKYESAYADVYLSTHIEVVPGVTVCDDWTRIVNEYRDDPDVDTILRMRFVNVTPDEIAAFKTGKGRLWTTDIELDVRRLRT
jgi:hypothetical protein